MQKKSAEITLALQFISDWYVPYVPLDVEGETLMKAVKKAVKIVITGDQLTKQNADAAIELREKAKKEMDKLQGLLPAITDFHCSMNFTDLVFKELHSTSCNEAGILYQTNKSTEYLITKVPKYQKILHTIKSMSLI